MSIIAEYARGSDLFICEGMYGELEKQANAREHRHMTMQEAAALGRQAEPDRMWLTHFSPSLNHPEEYLKELRKIYPPIQTGKDGMSVDLNFEEE